MRGQVGEVVFRSQLGPSSYEWRKAPAYFHEDQFSLIGDSSLNACARRIETSKGIRFIVEQNVSHLRIGAKIQFPNDGWRPVPGEFETLEAIESNLWPQNDEVPVRVVANSQTR
jgi:hypothetical protein